MFRKGSCKQDEVYKGHHRFEHWYRDNTIYFITARCRNQVKAFRSQHCKEIFWDRFTYYANQFGFKPIVVSLLDNHYHLLGYLKIGTNLGPMMQKIHGSVAKLVNDQLEDRLKPFFVDTGHQNYYDGCLRDVLQFRRTYRYTFTQSVRHGVCSDPEKYPHTKVYIDYDRAERRAVELKAFLEDLPYKRYDQRKSVTHKLDSGVSASADTE